MQSKQKQTKKNKKNKLPKDAMKKAIFKVTKQLQSAQMIKKATRMERNNLPTSKDSVRQYRLDANLLNSQSERKATYLDSVAVPEYARGAKIPSYSPLPTNAMHMKTTIKFVSNGIGDAALFINPYFLDTNANSSTGILINTDNALDVSNGAGASAFAGRSMASKLTAGTCAAYRLVSAAIHIYPETSSLTAQGYIAGGIVTATGRPDAYPTSGLNQALPGAAANTASIIDQAMYYQKAQIGAQAGIRAIYLPFDPSFEFFCAPTTGRCSLLTTNCDQFYWNYYVTGSQPGTNFVVEIYYNFELEPLAGGVLQLLATPREFNDSEKGLIKEVIRQPGIVSQSNGNLLQTAQAIDACIRNGKKKDLNFLDRALGWLNENSANITNILSVGSKMLASI